MATEIKHMRVDKDMRAGSLLGAAGNSPIIVELGDAAYRINPVGATSSPFTVESAYASVRTVDGRGGSDISAEELEAIIDTAKERFVQSELETLDGEE
ncbi:MAG TPA: hypothetical protein VNL35_08165 [Chloroflexota bacterium]|nr:hypothetical protein [Chloroflexota bacterium]